MASAKPMSKRNTPFWPDEANRRELSAVKEIIKAHTEQFVSISVILRRSLALYALKVGTMNADQVHREFRRLETYAQGRT